MNELQQTLNIINSGSGILSGGSSAVTGLVNLFNAIQSLAPR